MDWLLITWFLNWLRARSGMQDFAWTSATSVASPTSLLSTATVITTVGNQLVLFQTFLISVCLIDSYPTVCQINNTYGLFYWDSQILNIIVYYQNLYKSTNFTTNLYKRYFIIIIWYHCDELSSCNWVLNKLWKKFWNKVCFYIIKITKPCSVSNGPK